MSTPVSVYSKHHHHARTPTDILQAQMQQLIDLQHEEQELLIQEHQQQQQQQNQHPQNHAAVAADVTTTPTNAATATAAEAEAATTAEAAPCISYPQQEGVGMGTLYFPNHHNHHHHTVMKNNYETPSQSMNMSMSTTTNKGLIKSSNHLHLVSYGAMAETSQESNLLLAPPPPPPPPPPAVEPSTAYTFTATAATAQTLPQTVMIPNVTKQQQQQQQQQQAQQQQHPDFDQHQLQQHDSSLSGGSTGPMDYATTTAPRNSHQVVTYPLQQQQNHHQHEFHYGNPDTNTTEQQHGRRQQQQQQGRHNPDDGQHSRQYLYQRVSRTPAAFASSGNSGLCGRCCQRRQGQRRGCCCCPCISTCCTALLQRLLDHLQYFVHDAEALHRSFCYGAIDGMLTGSGILSSFYGMQLVTSVSPAAIRALVVAFTACACLADALCMAVGHVWTSLVLQTTAEQEHAMAELQFRTNKHLAKGKLVDMLLHKGMLKIDAMSLADTLEGYPDLFVSALMGETLTSGESHYNLPHAAAAAAVAAVDDHHHASSYHHQAHADVLTARLQLQQQQQQQQHDNMHDHHNDALQEARNESCFMLLGFALASIIPSLVFWAVPFYFQNGSISSSNSSKHNDSIETQQDASMWSMAGEETNTHTSTSGSASISSSGNINNNYMYHHHGATITIIVTAILMWCLGIWKSTFFVNPHIGNVVPNNSNHGAASSSLSSLFTFTSTSARRHGWIAFAVETVVVLMICILAAFGTGRVMSRFFLPDYILQVAKTGLV